MRWRSTPKAGGPLNLGGFIQTDQWCIISARPGSAPFLTAADGVNYGTKKGKKKKTPKQTKQKPRSSDTEVEERQRGRISDSHDGNLLQASVTHTLFSALFPEEALQQQLITVVYSLLWCWSWYQMQISASTITPTANYWHLRGCLFELSLTLIIRGPSEFWFALRTQQRERGSRIQAHMLIRCRR